MSPRSMVLVTGATGAVGPCVVHALHCAGLAVRTFSLDIPAEGVFPPNVQVLVGDVASQKAVESAMQDVDLVMHLAALLHIVNPQPALQAKYEQINIGGTSNVVSAAIKSGVKRVVLFSTIAVYGPSGGRIIYEHTLPYPDTFYAKTKLAAEKIVLGATDINGEKIGTVLRLGAVYGSRIKGNYERLTHALAHHRFIPIGSGLNRRTLIYDKDVAEAAVLAATHPSAVGRIFNVTDGQFHALNEIIKSICFALGRKPPRLSLPLGPVCFIANLIEKGARVSGLKLPDFRGMINKYNEDIAVNGDLVQKELGFIPRYDLQTAWQETIQEMRLR